MTAKGEMERLNGLGRDAADHASRFNRAMNGGARVDHTAAHAVGHTSQHRIPVIGRISVTLLVWLAVGLGFTLLSFPYPMMLALGVVILLELGFFALKRRRNTRLAGKAIGLQAQLHDLKQQEFDLRYQEAKENGQLDRFDTEK